MLNSIVAILSLVSPQTRAPILVHLRCDEALPRWRRSMLLPSHSYTDFDENTNTTLHPIA